jgi:hypothetical protein
MSDLFEVSGDDIKDLKPRPLVELLECLLENELASSGLPLSAASIALDINIPDGGEDGLVAWSGGVAETDFFPTRRCLFQSKSGTLSPADFVDELFKHSDRAELKDRVITNFDRGGTYILFYAGPCTNKDKAARIDEMKKALTHFYGGTALEVRIYDRSDIARWARKHLPATIKALRLAKKSGLETFQTWDDWSGFEANQINFVGNDQTQRFISLIRSGLRRPKEFIRIIGRSGLGKTRVVFEAFRRPERTSDDPLQAILSGSLAYVDYLNEEHVVGLVAQLRHRATGVVVVDNCPEEVHERLLEQIKHEKSQLSLVTIDYHVDESPDKPGVFRFEPSPTETIRAMIREMHPTLEVRDIEFIARYADGFPKIAALLRDVPLEIDVKVEPLNDKVLTDRLLRGRATMSEDVERVIEACALFVHLGFDGPVRRHREYVAVKICGITSELFYERAMFFMPRVLDKIGDYVRVSPVPLALRLAESYYNRKEPDAQARLFKDADMPGDLKDALGKRFKDLSTSERAEEVTRRLLSPTDPFGRAEVLNTEQGSLIFRSLAEVNPQVAMQTLIREFGDWSTDQLLTIGPGRRNLVWTLEMLAFNRDLFVQAALMLSRLAVAENETWGNNATGQFLHLFQPLLAGTEAGPEHRLEVIDRLLSSASDLRFIDLGVEALGRVLNEHGGGRMLGAETQRGRVLKDWSPKTWGELFSYLEGAAERLTRYATKEDELGAKARKLFARGIRYLVQYQRFDCLERSICEITTSYRRAWPEAVEEVQAALRYELKDGPSESVARVRSLLDLLQPADEIEQLRLVVSIPPFGNFEQDAHGGLRDLSAAAATELAKSYASHFNRWNDIISLVSTGEQRQGFTFGYATGDLLSDKDQEAYVDSALLALIKAGDQGNPAVLCGLLLALKPKNGALVSTTMSQVFVDASAARFAPYLVSALGPSADDLDRLLQLLSKGLLRPNDLRQLSYGRVLAPVDPESVCRFLMGLVRFELEGAYAALLIGYMYAKDEDKARWEACRPVFRSIASLPGIFEAKRDTFDKYALEESIKDLLQSEADESELATALTTEILKVCSKRELDFNAYAIMRPVFFELMQRYTTVTWPLVRVALDNAKGTTEWHLLHLFESRALIHESKESALLLLPQDEIKKWCSERPDLAPRLISSALPLFSYDGSTVHVHPLVQHIIDQYGNDKRVLSAISANLGSFGFVGSLVPAFQQRLEFAKQFTHHKRSAVRQWANNLIAGFEADIQTQRKRDEEHEHGIWSDLRGYGGAAADSDER